MFNLKILTLIVLLLYPSGSFAATSAMSTPPIVYTGIATFTLADNTPIHLLTRLHLIKTGTNPAGGDNYRAIVIQHLGDDASNEYTTYNYAFTTIDPKTRKVVLSPAVNTAASTQLPEFELTFDPSLEHAEGTMTHHFLSAKSGSVQLRNGWEYDKNAPIESRYGGLYAISCPEAPHALMGQAKKILIAPHKAPSFLNEINGALDSDVTYMAGVVTSFGAVPPNATVAAVLREGRAKFMVRKLVMMEGRNEWTCDRQDQETLLCRSTYHGACELHKIGDIHHSITERSIVQTEKIRIKSPELPVMNRDFDCESWNRTFYGYLRHRIGARLQPLKIEMRTLTRLDETGSHVCDIQVTGRLSFASHRILNIHSTESDSGTIIYKFPLKTISTSALTLQLVATNPSEIILTIRRQQPQGFSFDWVSQIFGVIGDVVVSDDPNDKSLPKITEEDALQGLNNHFQSERFGDQFLFMSLKTTPRLLPAYGAENNPFAGVEVGGWILQRNEKTPVEDAPRFAIRPDMYFDFYTNYFTMMDGNFIVGEITPLGLTTHEIRPGQFSIFNFHFMKHNWTKIPYASDISKTISAELQSLKPSPASPSHASPSPASPSPNANPSKMHQMLFMTQDTAIKRITFVHSDTFYSTKDWGALGGWSKVTSREVTSDWTRKSSVKVLVRYWDDRLVEGELPLAQEPK